MKFNINEYVKVRLTEVGRESLRKQHTELFRGYPSPMEYREPEVDAEGFTKFQLWDLMNKLGPGCWNGCQVPFEMEIEIPEPGLG